MQTTIPSLVGFAKAPWNKGRLIGQKRFRCTECPNPVISRDGGRRLEAC